VGQFFYNDNRMPRPRTVGHEASERGLNERADGLARPTRRGQITSSNGHGWKRPRGHRPSKGLEQRGFPGAGRPDDQGPGPTRQTGPHVKATEQGQASQYCCVSYDLRREVIAKVANDGAQVFGRQHGDGAGRLINRALRSARSRAYLQGGPPAAAIQAPEIVRDREEALALSKPGLARGTDAPGGAG
jgi:hypothetical protein